MGLRLYFYRENPFGPILSGYLCVLYDGTKRFIFQEIQTH